MKLLLIGTCHMDPIVEACRLTNVEADHMLLGFQPHDELDRDFTKSTYDACVVGPVLRHVLQVASGSNNELAFWRLDETEVTDLKLTALRYLEQKIVSISKLVGNYPLILLSFIEPSRSYVGDSFRYDQTLDFKEFVHEINKGVRTIAVNVGGLFVDVNISLDAVGREGAQCDVMSASTHASFIGDWDYQADSRRIVTPVKPSEFFGSGDRAFKYGKHLLYRLSKMIKYQKGQVVKLIIADLDDTMWRGVAAEEDFDLTMRREGWPYGLVEALLIFKKRGGMLAICSKNNREETEVRFREIWGNTITLDDFVSIKIGWHPKSESISEILQETNVLPDSVLFLDDNPREIDEVQKVFPTIRCIGLNHYSWRDTIIKNEDFCTSLITEESRKKTLLLKDKIARDVSMQSLNREEWLHSLQLIQKIDLVRDINSPYFSRASELLNKTNQFNTNGKRWELPEIGELFSHGGFFVVTWLADKNTDNGLIGLAVIDKDRILQVVLSCRVFGLGAEIVLISRACQIILLEHKVAYGTIIKTSKNFASLDVFDKCGFLKTDDFHYETSKLPVTPSWIQLA
jgi:FkbH-like protein